MLAQGALMDKWNAARAEADLQARIDAEQAAEPSLELLEERKRKRIAEWREGVDASDGNNNFVALGGADWRERVAKAKARRL